MIHSNSEVDELQIIEFFANGATVDKYEMK